MNSKKGTDSIHPPAGAGQTGVPASPINHLQERVRMVHTPSGGVKPMILSFGDPE